MNKIIVNSSNFSKESYTVVRKKSSRKKEAGNGGKNKIKKW